MCGGEFEGERDAVEAAADGLHGGAVGVVEGEPGEGGAVGEQGDRVVGDRQRVQGQYEFAGQSERFAAGDEDTQAGEGGQQGLDERGAVREDVFAGVEHQQQPFAVGPFGHHLGDGAGGLVGEPQRLHDGEADQARGVQGREFHQPDAVGVGLLEPGQGAQGEPGLADSADADDAQEPVYAHRGIQLGLQPAQFLPPSDEAVRLGRQIAGAAAGGMRRLGRFVGHDNQSGRIMTGSGDCPGTRTEERRHHDSSGHLSTRCDQLPVGEGVAVFVRRSSGDGNEGAGAARSTRTPRRPRT
ncbi:hypothetical protein ACFV03_38805 [Streptomyces mirabilis]|uniref:hypothetical protein n=1 Tax=Streptomyces mirabilis TaxID=68239 RepID=UPI0036899286